MARKALGPAAWEVARAVSTTWPGGDVVVGVSGGADSLALAAAAGWCAARQGGAARAVIVDHQLQPGSDAVAAATERQLREHGLAAEVRTVTIAPSPDGIEAAARDARLDALASDGLPVLLGHTLDDQAEQVFLGLIRGSGTRSLAGMAPERPPFLRPLLGVRRETTVAACAEWGLEPWQDPMNDDPSFMRVRVRRWLEQFQQAVGRDVAPNLARTAALARADADLLDELIQNHDKYAQMCPYTDDLRESVTSVAGTLPVGALARLPDALRWRKIKAWLEECGAQPAMEHVFAVDALVTNWRGQGPIDVPGARIRRHADELTLLG